MDMETMYPYPSQYPGLPHWKCVSRCCDKFPVFSIPHQEKNKYATNTCLTIRFHLYCNVSSFTVHFIRPYEEQKICYKCYTDISSLTPGRLYKRKELVLFETLISEFHKNNIFQKFKNWHFILHMCVLLERVPVSNNSARNLNTILNKCRHVSTDTI